MRLLAAQVSDGMPGSCNRFAVSGVRVTTQVCISVDSESKGRRGGRNTKSAKAAAAAATAVGISVEDDLSDSGGRTSLATPMLLHTCYDTRFPTSMLLHPYCYSCVAALNWLHASCYIHVATPILLHPCCYTVMPTPWQQPPFSLNLYYH